MICMNKILGSLACMLSFSVYAQPPIAPPIGTDFNSGIPSDWLIETDGNIGWVFDPTIGYNESGGLIMDCGTCTFPENTTIWSPWMDLSGHPTIDIHFNCAIVAGSSGIAPPFVISTDGIGGPEYHRIYGMATLIPPPDEVIPYTTNPFPPLDPSNVTWVDITYNYYPGLYNDSVRIGFGAWPPFDGYAMLDEIQIGTSSPEVQLATQVFLQGPYDSIIDLMNDDLRMSGLIPLQEPYTSLGYSHVGGGGETFSNSLLSTAGNNALVDWVVIELRSNGDPSNILATRSALLQRDGDVVDIDGSSPLTFPVSSGTYYVVVRHRNHLGCMKLSSDLLDADPMIIDFRSIGLSTYGTEARKNVGGTMLLWAGDAMPDDQVKYTGSNNDRDAILSAIGGAVPTASLTGYRVEDVNLDGVVKYTGLDNDRDIILQTIGGTVPTNTRIEQLP